MNAPRPNPTYERIRQEYWDEWQRQIDEQERQNARMTLLALCLPAPFFALGLILLVVGS